MKPAKGWTAKKLFCYFAYYFFAKHLPGNFAYGKIGKLSGMLRRFLCRRLFLEAADVFSVEKGAEFGTGALIVIKEFGNLGIRSQIFGYGKCIIGSHVMMGPEVMCITHDHPIEDGRLVAGPGHVAGDIVIGDHAWIGARVIMLRGVRIGEHCVVGAGSVVTKSLPPYTVCAGAPARVVKQLKSDLAAT